MDHFDLPPPGLVLKIVVLLVVVPLGFAIFVPLAVFRASFRTHRAAWAQTRPFVVDGAYRARRCCSTRRRAFRTSSSSRAFCQKASCELPPFGEHSL